jgi:hypothetical protein
VYFSLIGLGEAARVVGDLEYAKPLLDESLRMTRAAAAWRWMR